MKTILICPAVRPTVTQLSESVPLAITPLLGQNLLSFWLEHVASLGAKHATVVVVDRPELVRAEIGDGSRWGLRVEFVTNSSEPSAAEATVLYRKDNESGWLPAPHDVVVMNHLPGAEALPLFESYASWFAALQAWMPRALTPGRVRMREYKPGIWVGTGARIGQNVQLNAPCWIGDHVTIESDAIIGPGAILEDRAVVDMGARVANSVVGPDTFVGRLTSVAQSIAAGNLLVNWRNDSVLRVPDPFLLCSLVKVPSLLPVPEITRGVAALTRVATRPFNAFTALFSRSNRAGDAKLPG